MKKNLKIFAVLMLITVACSVFAACDKTRLCGYCGGNGEAKCSVWMGQQANEDIWGPAPTHDCSKCDNGWVKCSNCDGKGTYELK